MPVVPDVSLVEVAVVAVVALVDERLLVAYSDALLLREEMSTCAPGMGWLVCFWIDGRSLPACRHTLRRRGEQKRSALGAPFG